MFLSRLKESRYATLILASIFAFTLFLQCCYFHYQAFHSILISSLWNDPVAFFTFYTPKISISLFIASFVFLFKRKSWAIYVSFIVSIWCIAELVYYRANGIFLDAFSFTMVGNMDGFWDSIFVFIYINDFIIFVPTLIILIVYYLFNDKARKLSLYVSAILICCTFHVMSVKGIQLLSIRNQFPHEKNYYNPFNKDSILNFWGFTNYDYIKQTSLIHGLVNETKNLILLPFENNNYVMSDLEKQDANEFINQKSIYNHHNNNLIIILVESFENWAITEYTMPNIYHFIKENDNILYHKRIKKQTKGATSADGQMIINTGLLPIKSGATCYQYPYNVYPALSKLYNSSVGLIPGNLGTWNQKRMSDAYGFKENILNPYSDDSIMVTQLNDVKHKYDYILAITMASHSPFKFCAQRSQLELAYDIPSDISYYLKSINFTDTHLGSFLSSIQSDSILRNSTIVITGDHTIFPSEIRKEFSDYCKANNLDYKVEENYCPLIIYSPNIKEKTIVDEEAYQMDIYPTILNVIGAEDYYWKGFGVNLLDSVARQNRPISPEEAFELSDKLIRANYFKEIEDSLYSTIK